VCVCVLVCVCVCVCVCACVRVCDVPKTISTQGTSSELSRVKQDYYIHQPRQCHQGGTRPNMKMDKQFMETSA